MISDMVNITPLSFDSNIKPLEMVTYEPMSSHDTQAMIFDILSQLENGLLKHMASIGLSDVQIALLWPYRKVSFADDVVYLRIDFDGFYADGHLLHE